IQQRQRSLKDIAGIWVTPPRTFAGDPPEQVKAALVTTNFFDVLGDRPVSGRTFVKDDGDGPFLILADSLFRRRLEGKTGLIGQALTREGGNVLVGVLPGDFELHFAPEANVPNDVQVYQAWGPEVLNNGNYIIRLVARLKNGMTPEAAQSDLNR